MVSFIVSWLPVVLIEIKLKFNYRKNVINLHSRHNKKVILEINITWPLTNLFT